jgi:DNA-binding beta-propeller fold protein YncE
LFFSLVLASLIFCSDYFAIIKSFDIGKRAFHIQSNYNYAIISDYDGTVHFIDFFTFEYFKYENAVIPMGGVYDGEYFYIIDNSRSEVLKLSKNTVIKRISLDSRPTKIFYYNSKIYLTSFRTDKVYILDKDLNIKSVSNMPVRSPAIRKANGEIYIPLFHNVVDGAFQTNFLFFNPDKNTYIFNYQNIRFPKDILEKDGKTYIISYFDGTLYENSLISQKKVANLGAYSNTILNYKDYIVANSLMGGIYYFNPLKKEVFSILNEIPIKEISISPDGKFLYAISHIENKLYIIESKTVYQEISVGDYPIDVYAPDNNIVLVLSTDEEKLQIIRRFE